MRSQRTLFSLALIALLSLTYFGWTHTQPAFAQQPPPPGVGQPPRAYPPFMGPGAMMRFGMAQITANNNYVFILRGDMVYQLRANDLSVVAQKELPAMDASPSQGR